MANAGEQLGNMFFRLLWRLTKWIFKLLFGWIVKLIKWLFRRAKEKKAAKAAAAAAIPVVEAPPQQDAQEKE